MAIIKIMLVFSKTLKRICYKTGS